MMQSVNAHYCVLTSDIPYQQFYDNVMRRNVVCLLDQHFTRHWPCRHDWLLNNTLNLNSLKDKYGSHLCPVYNCDSKYFDSNPKESMPFSQYIDYWKKAIATNYEYGDNLHILYLKDWHFFQETNETNVYNVLEYFESDYLNEYCQDKRLTDYRFVYMGPKLSSTPLHVDVFGSFSWSSNICGLKKWLLIPPCNVAKLKQMFKELPSDLYSVEGRQELFQLIEAFEIIQKPGETIFVPSGFMHQVINLEDTVSINHNWFNACNLESIYANILSANNQVQIEISDLREICSEQDWQDNCQKILAMHFGLNFHDFVDIIFHVSHRLSHEKERCLVKFRFLHDVDTILRVALMMKCKEEFQFCWDKIDAIIEQMQHITTGCPV